MMEDVDEKDKEPEEPEPPQPQPGELFFKGQFLEVKDTVNKWLPAEVRAQELVMRPI